MSEMIERMTIAAWELFNSKYRAGKLRPWRECDEELKNQWRDMTRAGLQEMRLPNDEMLQAMSDVSPFAMGTETHRIAGGIYPVQYYEAAIEAALS